MKIRRIIDATYSLLENNIKKEVTSAFLINQVVGESMEEKTEEGL